MEWLIVGLLAAGGGADRLDFQLMTSPAYQLFASEGERLCPSQKLRYLHPADLDLIEETFFTTIPRRLQGRIIRESQTKSCPPAGLSCPAQHTLESIIKVGLLKPFMKAACSTAP
jgi:hypothetical protein